MITDSTLESLVGTYLDYRLSNVFTCLPAEVVGISNLDQQRVDVKPVINRLFKDGESIEHPAILSVCLQFPSSSTSAVTFPVNQGDTVLLVFSQRGMDVFKGGDGTASDPTDYRVFDKRDAIAIPSIFPFQKSINKQTNRTLPHDVNDMVVSHNIGTESECEIRMKVDGSVNITSPLKVEITSPQVEVVGNLNVLGVSNFIGATTITGAATMVGPVVMSSPVPIVSNANMNIVGSLSVSGVSAFTGLTSINGGCVMLGNLSVVGINIALTSTTFTWNGSPVV